jgi:hypothetical protein
VGHSRASGFSHITVTAAVFVAALIGISAWQIVRAIGAKNAATTFASATSSSDGNSESALASSTNSDPIAAVSTDAIGELVGAYNNLQAEGAYSTSTGVQVGGAIGQNLEAPVSYNAFTSADVKTNTDTSYKGMMQYRSDLQTSLKPLLLNTEPEYEIFGLYVETKQQTYLDQLHAAANNYRLAASSTAALTVPADAVNVQLGLLNSMEEFAATLDALAEHAQDPISSTVLLENYNQSESDVLNAFQALVTYEKNKTQ